MANKVGMIMVLAALVLPVAARAFDLGEVMDQWVEQQEQTRRFVDAFTRPDPVTEEMNRQIDRIMQQADQIQQQRRSHR